MKNVGFTFTKIVIIQSLEPNEPQTGNHLVEYLHAIAMDHKIPTVIELWNCDNYLNFHAQLIALTNQAKDHSEIPIIHIECHGDKSDGLEFSNGSNLTWEELSNLLLKLNIATNFNLLTLLSACYGSHFLGQFNIIKPAPCWCIVAPTEEVDPGELMLGFREFYSLLFRSLDMGEALKHLSNKKLSKGIWFSESAEIWFEKLLVNYLETQCTVEIVNPIIKRRYRSLTQEGLFASIGKLKRLHRDYHRTILSKYFDVYFCVEQVKENTVRFNQVKKRVDKKYQKLRTTGKYIL